MLRKALLRFSRQLNSNFVQSIRAELASAAQEVYMEWEQNEQGEDELLGVGGICQDIADRICAVLDRYDIECASVSSAVGEQHVFTIAKLADGVFVVDIPPSVYEIGAGYTWSKRPDVQIEAQDVYVDCINADPDTFDQYAIEL